MKNFDDSDLLEDEEYLDDETDETDDEDVSEVEKENEKLLEEFKKYLLSSGLSKNTVRRHVDNADLYINDFLLRYDVIEAADGMSEIGMFLGDFFIRHCMWSTPNSIKTTAASIKKFYFFMTETGRADKVEYVEMCLKIKEEMPEWQDFCMKYNDVDYDLEDLFDI